MSIFTNSASSSPEQTKQYVAALLDLLGETEPMEVLHRMAEALGRTLAQFSATEAKRPEATGKWSAGDVLQHLADSELVWAYRLRMVLAQDHPHLTGYDQDLWAQRLRYEEGDPEEALERFGVLRASNLSLLETASEQDLQRVGLHAERGEETLEHMIRLYAAHDLLHLRQLDRLRGAITS